MFAGTRFWIAQRVPQRGEYKRKVQSHDGIVTPLERDADILISDHVRPKDAPPGALSYQFIEDCIRKGYLLQDEERAAHLCGPKLGSVRDVADATRAPKGRQRIAFTAEDDDVIRNWVMDGVRRGERLRGNEVWKDLERQNARHTWQSWRDRWIKKLAHQMPPGWELEVRPLEDDVDNIVAEVLEAEGDDEKELTENTDLQQQEERRLKEKRKEKRERERQRPTKKNEAVSQRQRSQHEGEVSIAQSTGSKGSKSKNSITRPSPPQRVSPVACGRVMQSMLKSKRRESTPQLPPSSSPIAKIAPPRIKRKSVETTQPQRQNSRHTVSDFDREPSVGERPTQTKRAKHHHQQQEKQHDEASLADSSVLDATSESRDLARPFTAEDFLILYESIDHIMSLDNKGLQAFMMAFAASTDFTAQEWLQFLRNDVLPIQKGFKNILRRHHSVIACLKHYIAHNPHQPWRRWRMHYEATSCGTLAENMSPSVPGDSQVSQNEDVRPHTPTRTRQDNPDESSQVRSPRVAETANISRQRVDINSQSTASGNTQADSSQAIDDEDPKLTKDESTFLHTQAILTAETQSLDLSMPEPSSEFDESIAESIESDDIDMERIASLRDQELINQQLLDDSDQTEIPIGLDVNIPMPEDGFEATDDLSEGAETQFVKGTQALGGKYLEASKTDVDEVASQSSLDFDALADELMEKGHSPEDIFTAFQITSANIPMVFEVLESLRSGRGVPKAQRGVWTEEDDKDILGGDARKLERVEAKHGWNGEGGCKNRQYFLRDSIAAAEEAKRP